jgi:hypothetical protein
VEFVKNKFKKMDFLAQIALLIFFLSPIVLIAGIIVIIKDKKNKKTGVKMVLGSVIIMIIGLGLCAAAINGNF